ncbi:MAG: S9 family peptidase [Betaproteobacteria bacterium]|nr:S9 family peptidase [Betaproteobacteria bacterium]
MRPIASLASLTSLAFTLLFSPIALCQPAASAAQAAAKSAPIPVEDFIKHAEFDDVSLSPDGKMLAVVARQKSRANLAIIDLDTRKLNWVTQFDQYDVYGYQWLDSKRLTVTVVDTLDDASGNIRYRGTFAVNTDGSGTREMGGFSVVRESVEKPGSVIILAGGRSRGPEVYRMDTRTGQRDLLTFDNPGNVFRWVVDRKDEVRVAVSADPDKDRDRVTLFYRADQKSPWVKLQEFNSKEVTIDPIAFDFDHKTLYVRSNKGRSNVAIFRYDLDKKDVGELVSESAHFDLGSLRFDVVKQKMVGVNTGERNKSLSGMTWLDADWERTQKMIDDALPGRMNFLSWGREVPHRVLVSSWSDTHPGSYFLLDTKTNKMERLVERRSWIDSSRMSPMTTVRYAARDGLGIQAFLTLPKGADGKPGKGLPLVVDIHGGPHVHGFNWGFNETAQFLASRGYAVLQPNFRGSTGYGRKFMEAGFRQWGLAMQDDITDGVRWAIKEGHADPKRVCLMGGSYGGYATLYGLIKEQGMFRCGIAAVAVTDLELLLTVSWSDTYHSDAVQDIFKERIGDLKKDAAYFRQVSPLYHADKISAPVLLAFGSDDRRVPLIHGEKFRAALDDHKKPYEWVVYTAEGHGFNKRENRIDYYKRIEAFLQKHMTAMP